MLNFQSVAKYLLPSWIYDGGEGERVASVVSATVDASLERVYQSVVSRFPSYAGDSALAKIGEDRGITRGRTESREHYAARLIRWRYPRGHRVRGNAFALLDQISEYFGGLACWTIDRSGNRCDVGTDGSTSSSTGNTWTWDAGPPEEWSRFWIVLEGGDAIRPHPPIADITFWGGNLGTPGYAIGQLGAITEDVQAVRRMLDWRAWRPAGAQPEWLVVNLGTTITPDATWAHWSKNLAGVQVPARNSSCRYWSLDPLHNNVYAGDDTNFPSLVTMPDATLYGGDPTRFPLTPVMPDGTTYAGDPTKFPTLVRLVDDGDPIP